MNENVLMPEVEVPKGLIKIELFDDDTKEKLDEINTHNFISNGVKQYLFKAKMRDVFTKGRVSGGGEVSLVFEDLFKQISLTTADHPEEPNTEWLRKGTLIGYAYSDGVYSGSDALRGTYNSNESFTTPEQVHMVFDFPTSSANGTFNSIYFHPSTNPTKNNAYFTRPILTSSSASVKKHDNKYYVLTLRDTLAVYDLNWELLNQYTLPYNDIKDFEIVGNEIFYVRNTTTGTIQKANLTTPTTLSAVISTDASGGIAYDSINQRFIVSSRNSSNFLVIKYYSESFAVLDSKTTNLGYDPSESNISTSLFFDNGYLFIAGRVFDENLIHYSFNNIKGMNNETMFMSLSPSVYEVPKVYIGSRALLDTPVTKTSNVTMKITYDFMLPAMY